MPFKSLCLLSVLASLSLTSLAQHRQLSEAAQLSNAARASSNHLQNIFNSGKGTNAINLHFGFSNCCDGSDACCFSCCPWGGFNLTQLLAVNPSKRKASFSTADFETLSATGSPTTTAGSSPTGKVTKNLAHDEDGRPSGIVDVTDKFYHLDLSGHSANAIPVIVENAAGHLLTLIANTDLTLTENYISSSLVSALGLTNTLTVAPSDGPSTAVFGNDFNSAQVSLTSQMLSLSLIAGRSDNFFPSVKFQVFTEPSATTTYVPNLFVGVRFLHDAKALALTPEYSGAEAAANENVDILVSKIYAHVDGATDHEAGSGEQQVMPSVKHEEL